MNRDDYQLHGFAIVCNLGCIADASGVLPQTLANDADWAYFQDQLDRAAITILGRRGHQRAPNPKGRKRMIVSSSVATIERRADGYWWWNPAGLPLLRALAVAAPGGGIVADSDPDAEYQETMIKSRALLEAVRLAEEGLI